MATAGQTDQPAVKHVLLISVDGLHQSDVTQCIALNICPTIEMLTDGGTSYSNAMTSEPSDSAPGLMNIVSGGTPKTTGVYYDDSYDRTMFAPADQSPGGTQDCSGTPGAETMLAENVDVNAPTVTNSAGTRTILGESVDPAQMPYIMQNGQCVPVMPNNFLRDNTVFSVAHAAGMYTAWADKHPVYNAEVAGLGTPDAVNDPFNSEINADIIPPSLVDTRGNTVNFPITNNGTGPYFITDAVTDTASYDQIKVDAVLNEIDGRNSANTADAPVPAIFGMNFQTVSVGQKLVDPLLSCVRNGPFPGCQPTYEPGGYVTSTVAGQPPQFTPQMINAVTSVDAQLGEMVNELQTKGLMGSTEIVLTAKHGQSPIDPSKLALIGHAEQKVLTNAGIQIAQLTDDDVALVWLKDQSQTQAAVDALENSIKNGNPARIQYVIQGDQLTDNFHSPTQDPRTPDLIIQPIPGTIYSGSTAKVAEHGGFSIDDTHVALVVFNGANPLHGHHGHGLTVDEHVSTNQVAPTILDSLGLNPRRLDAVRSQHTQALPGQGH